MYECPNCAGNLKFDIARQQLHCEYCGTMMDPYQVSGERDAEEKAGEYEVTVFTCPQCGGEILSEDTTAAVSADLPPFWTAASAKENGPVISFLLPGQRRTAGRHTKRCCAGRPLCRTI